MSDPIMQQYAMGAGAVALGLLAWFLPYRWNPFRFKRFIASMMSEAANQRVPKVIGAILGILGIAFMIATFFIGEFK